MVVELLLGLLLGGRSLVDGTLVSVASDGGLCSGRHGSPSGPVGAIVGL